MLLQLSSLLEANFTIYKMFEDLATKIKNFLIQYKDKKENPEDKLDEKPLNLKRETRKKNYVVLEIFGLKISQFRKRYREKNPRD